MIEVPEGAVIGHTLAGVVHHNTRDSELAVFAFSRVIELDPDLKRMPLKPRSMFWTEFGHNLIEVGRGNEARRYLHRGLAEGDDAKVADLLGQSYYLEELDDAEHCWRLAAMGPEPLRHLVANRQARSPAGQSIEASPCLQSHLARHNG